MSDRNIESDLRGLVKIHKACFKRNDNPIPTYRGQDIEHKPFDSFKIKERLTPGTEAFEYEKEHDRELGETLLACAFQLGFDLCWMAKYQPEQKTSKMIGELIRVINEHRKKNDVALIDALAAITKSISVFDYDVPNNETMKALRDLRENTGIMKLLEAAK